MIEPNTHISNHYIHSSAPKMALAVNENVRAITKVLLDFFFQEMVYLSRPDLTSCIVAYLCYKDIFSYMYTGYHEFIHW